MGFVHLHVHSQYSLLDGTMGPDVVAGQASSHGMTAVALTDTANMYGAVAFYKACKKKGIKPILGAELHVQPEGIHYADPRGVRGGYQLVVLVENDLGYRNLCALITKGIFDGMHFKPRVDLELLAEHRQGLIVLTGGIHGALGEPLAKDRPDEARQRFDGLARIFDKDHLYLELQDQGLPNQDAILAGTRALAAETGFRSVVTNGVHYDKADSAAVHELLNAIAMGCSMANAQRVVCPTDQAWLKPEAEMRTLFPDDGDAIDLTGEIAERCTYHFDFDTYHFPATIPPQTDPEGGPDPDTDRNWEYFYNAFPPPKIYECGEGLPPHPPGAGNLEGYFEWYSRRGLEVRLKRIDSEIHGQYWERLDVELGIINSMGFAAYFLIVAEFINWSKDNDIPVGPGRGSAAGSVIAWAMRIVDIDPIRFDLLFERFLNPERVSMPDIDVDFCQDRREEAIEHVREKYGTDYVSQIITYGKLKAKAAVRDVARVLDLSFTEADMVAKLIPDTLGIKLKDALKESEGLAALYAGDPKIRRVLNLAMRVEGTYRQTGVHAAGVVIADKPLVQYAPLYRDEPEGGPVVQYDMKSAESIGLIKFDFLGLKTLDQIRDALANIVANHGVHIDMSDIPVDDERTFTLLQDGDALGVFQLESSGMRELLTRLRPTVLDDLVALVALYRPGPLSSGMVDDFVDRKHGRQEVVYPLPMLEPILKSTYGTIVYQEQVMQIAQVMGGYSLGEADLLRRAMGKKDHDEMARQRGRFVSGASAREIPEEKSEEIFDLLAKFAAYGFNRSHSAAYGYISYQTAYLKAHYRPEYMAALMTSESGNTDKVLMYIDDCRNTEMGVLPVNLNESFRPFTVPKGSRDVRFGLSAVKNVGGGAIDGIVAEREKNGPFKNAFDVFERVDHKFMNKRVAENLIKAGAFDFSGEPRRALLEGLEDAVAAGGRAQRDKAVGQGSLFGLLGGGDSSNPSRFRFPLVNEYSLSKKLEMEREVLGLYLTGHPMEAHVQAVERYATCSLGNLAQADTDLEVRIIGMAVDVRAIRTKRGDKMAFVQFQDHEATVEVVFFTEPWARSHKAVDSGEPIVVIGNLEIRNDEMKILARSAEPLAAMVGRTTRKVEITLDAEEAGGAGLTELKRVLAERHGKCRSRLILRVPGQFEAGFELPQYPVEPSPELVEDVNRIFNRNDVVAMS